MQRKKWLALVLTLTMVLTLALSYPVAEAFQEVMPGMQGLSPGQDNRQPAAPAVAARILQGEERGMPVEEFENPLGYYISRVAREMGPGAVFGGVEKSDVKDYEDEVSGFLEDDFDGLVAENGGSGSDISSDSRPSSTEAVNPPGLGEGDRGEKINVLVGFDGPPAKDIVEKQGGKVYREFNIVDALAVEMTREAAEALRENRAVRYVELDGPVYAEEVGVLSSNQTIPWGIDRVFGDESYSFDTWDKSTGFGVGVAVLDTGIDEGHEDLDFDVSRGTNTIDDTSWDSDVSGHGTHVAGTIAALDNDLGVVGVAPEVELYAVKVLDDSGGGTISSVVGGIDWAVEKGISVLNMSLGSGSHSQTLQEACDAAYEDGHLLVSSAGNSGNPAGRGNNVTYPARYESVIAVAASDENDSRARFSSTGPDVELIAPGVNVLSTVPDNKYEEKSGTSMASPHVAGVAALAWAANEDLTNMEIREIMEESAECLDLPSNHQGHGLVRADLAVTSTEETKVGEPEVETIVVSNVTDTSATLEGELKDLGGAKSVKVWFEWAENKNLEDAEETDKKTLEETGAFEDVIDELEPEITYYFKALAENDAGIDKGEVKEFTTEKEGEEGGLADPVIVEWSVSTRTSGPWHRVDVVWEVSHPDVALDEVKSELLDGDEDVLDSQTTTVSGESASGEHNLRTRGNADKVRLTVTDTGGNEVIETKDKDIN